MSWIITRVRAVCYGPRFLHSRLYHFDTHILFCYNPSATEEGRKAIR